MFEKREVTRKAAPEEKADLINRLLEVLSTIDITQEEAKAAAADFRGIIADLHKREIGLRFNLSAGTVTQEVDVHAVINEATSQTEYYNREGNEVIELRHETSKASKEQNAMKKQIDLFEKSGELAAKLTDEMQKTFGHDVTVTVGESQANENSNEPPVNEYEQRRDELADELGVSDEQVFTASGDPSTVIPDELPDTMASVGNNSVTEEQTSVVTTDLEQSEIMYTTPQPAGAGELPMKFEDVSEKTLDINGAIAILTGTDKPLPKVSRKRKAEPVTT
jgi:hypothetical protein